MLIAAGASAADEILLKNGNVFRGKILSETEREVVIGIPMNEGEEVTRDKKNFIEMTVDKANIKSITRDSTIFRPIEREVVGEEKTPVEPVLANEENKTSPAEKTPATETAPNTNEQPVEGEGKTTDNNNKEEAATEKPVEEQLDPALQAQIDALVKNLGSGDEAARNKAAQKLQSIGKDATPSLVKALLSGGNTQRIDAAKVLGEIRDKRAIQGLIKALEGGRDDRTRMRFVYNALKSVTGQSFFFNEDGNANKRRAEVAKWQEWFDGAKEELPEQVGL
jgi:hypothetical protein